MKVHKLKNYYREQGRILAAKDFENKLKKIILEHEKNIKKLENIYTVECARIELRAEKTEKEYQDKITSLDILKDTLNKKISEVSLMRSEALDILNDLKAHYHNERVNKSVKLEYAKSSLDYLEKKTDAMQVKQ